MEVLIGLFQGFLILKKQRIFRLIWWKRHIPWHSFPPIIFRLLFPPSNPIIIIHCHNLLSLCGLIILPIGLFIFTPHGHLCLKALFPLLHFFSAPISVRCAEHLLFRPKVLSPFPLRGSFLLPSIQSKPMAWRPFGQRRKGITSWNGGGGGKKGEGNDIGPHGPSPFLLAQKRLFKKRGKARLNWALMKCLWSFFLPTFRSFAFPIHKMPFPIPNPIFILLYNSLKSFINLFATILSIVPINLRHHLFIF